MIIGGKEFKNYTYVMAIINITPDSFFAGSRATSCDDVLFRVEKAVEDGAAIIDIGAQSTRPNYTEVSAEEEISRLEAPLYAIKKRFDIPVSVDTYFSKCAAAALDLGADMINDVSGLSRSADMASLIAKRKASVCIMHNAAKPVEGDVFPPVMEFLRTAADKALAAGIDKERICLDGGIGFAKDREQNFNLLNSYGRLHELGYPLLLGASRKSMFGGDVRDRLEPTLNSTRLAARQGILFVRVHDVRENVSAIKEIYENG